MTRKTAPQPKTFGVRADTDLIACWKEEAAARGVSVSDMIREAVALYCVQVPRPSNPKFTDEQIERGREQMRAFFNRLGLK